MSTTFWGVSAWKKISVHLLKMCQETGKCFQEILRVGINGERMSKTYKINVCMNNKTIYGFSFRVLRIMPDRRGCYSFTYTAEYSTGYLLSDLLYMLCYGIIRRSLPVKRGNFFTWWNGSCPLYNKNMNENVKIDPFTWATKTHNGERGNSTGNTGNSRGNKGMG